MQKKQYINAIRIKKFTPREGKPLLNMQINFAEFKEKGELIVNEDGFIHLVIEEFEEPTHSGLTHSVFVSTYLPKIKR